MICVQGQRRVGFHIHHNESMSQRTSIWFSRDSEQIFVDRSHSNNEADINKDGLSGPFTLFVCNDSGVETMERFHLRVFADGDVLEIFANDRFALSTVVYADVKSCTGISWLAEGEDNDEAVFESINLWDQFEKVQGDDLNHRL